MLKSIAFSAKPRATEVNSLPPRIRFSPNRVSKIFLTAGTNEEPPVRKTISTSSGRMPEESRRESTHRAICPSFSEIHSSKDVRSAIAFRSTKPSSEHLRAVEGATAQKRLEGLNQSTFNIRGKIVLYAFGTRPRLQSTYATFLYLLKIQQRPIGVSHAP